MKKTTFRAPLEDSGLRDRACAIDLETKLQKCGIETSVRPNGTPVMPVLRSWSTVIICLTIIKNFLCILKKAGHTHTRTEIVPEFGSKI